MTSSYYRGANGIVIVFDLTNPETFKNCERWLIEVKRYMNGDAPVLIVGNKSDLVKDRTVPFTDAKDFADLQGFEYVETSAKDSSIVDGMFSHLASMLVKKYETE